MSRGQMITVVVGDPAVVDTGLDELGSVTWSSFGNPEVRKQ